MSSSNDPPVPFLEICDGTVLIFADGRGSPPAMKTRPYERGAFEALDQLSVRDADYPLVRNAAASLTCGRHCEGWISFREALERLRWEYDTQDIYLRLRLGASQHLAVARTFSTSGTHHDSLNCRSKQQSTENKPRSLRFLSHSILLVRD